jgi:hypothetical protein
MGKIIMAAAGILAITAAAAAAQSPVPPHLDGELTASDRADAQGRRYDEYRIDARAGQSLTIAAAAANGSGLDPAIEVHAPAGAITRDDDGGAGTGARVALRDLSNGVYRVRVLGGAGATGRYRLTISGGGAPAGGGVPDGTPGAGPAPAPLGGAGQILDDGPRDAFIICPGHPRCPR